MTSAEDVARDSDRFSIITRAMSDGVYDWNVEENSLYVSDRLNDIFGFESGSLTSEAWIERVFPDDKENYAREIQRHFRGESERLECEYRLRKVSGEYIWIRDRSIAVRNEDKRAIRLVGTVVDITAEVEQKAELDQANTNRNRLLSEFNTVLEAIDYGIIFLDADLKARFINRSIREMWGLDDDFISQNPTWLELLERNRAAGIYVYDDEAWQSFVDQRTTILMRGDSVPVELERADGSVLQVRFVSLPDGGRMITYYDVTPFKELERQLRASDERYEEVMNVVGEGVYEFQVGEETAYYSPLVTEMLGLESGTLMNRQEDWLACVHPEDRSLYVEKFSDTFKKGLKQFVFEYRFLRSDGSVRWARQRGVVDYDENGRAIRVVGSTGDITSEIELKDERDAARQTLYESVEVITEGIVLFDANDRIILCNSRFSSYFSEVSDIARPGTRFEDLLRVATERGIFPHAPSDFNSWFGNIREGRKNPAGTREQHLANGLWLQISERRTADGGLVAVYTDVSSLKETAEELRQARDQAEQTLLALTETQDKLVHAEKMASLGQLTAGIAHEIKNPLNFINNFARLSTGMLEEFGEIITPILPQLSDDDREEADDLLQTVGENLTRIDEHGRRADGIVQNMLAHSREAPSEQNIFDINAMLTESLQLAYHGTRAENPQFNVSLNEELAENIPPFTGYQQDLSRVFINLFTNGFHATTSRAQSAGETGAEYEPSLRITSQVIDNKIEIRVRDNGTGMPADIAEQIFNPFFTTKPAGEGTGLGLSLSFDIISKQHDGEIDVTSEDGAFTEFRVSLPMAQNR
jgi:PAS domain S-box-containing protein